MVSLKEPLTPEQQDKIFNFLGLDFLDKLVSGELQQTDEELNELFGLIPIIGPAKGVVKVGQTIRSKTGQEALSELQKVRDTITDMARSEAQKLKNRYPNKNIDIETETKRIVDEAFKVESKGTVTQIITKLNEKWLTKANLKSLVNKYTVGVLGFSGIMVWFGLDNLNGGRTIHMDRLSDNARFGEDTDTTKWRDALREINKFDEQREITRLSIIANVVVNPLLWPFAPMIIRGTIEEEQRQLDIKLDVTENALRESDTEQARIASEQQTGKIGFDLLTDEEKELRLGERDVAGQLASGQENFVDNTPRTERESVRRTGGSRPAGQAPSGREPQRQSKLGFGVVGR